MLSRCILKAHSRRHGRNMPDRTVIASSMPHCRCLWLSVLFIDASAVRKGVHKACRMGMRTVSCAYLKSAAAISGAHTGQNAGDNREHGAKGRKQKNRGEQAGLNCTKALNTSYMPLIPLYTAMVCVLRGAERHRNHRRTHIPAVDRGKHRYGTLEASAQTIVPPSTAIAINNRRLVDHRRPQNHQPPAADTTSGVGNDYAPEPTHTGHL